MVKLPLSPVDVLLRPRQGDLTVSASISGARVFVDGALRGVTPLEVSLDPGRYKVRVVADDHVPFEQQVAVTASGSVPLFVALRRSTGELLIRAKTGDLMPTEDVKIRIFVDDSSEPGATLTPSSTGTTMRIF